MSGGNKASEIRRENAGLVRALGDLNKAIAREKQLKRWERKWKLALIEHSHREWADL
jgi:predicted GIY-YIG superfamily endonuclease